MTFCSDPFLPSLHLPLPSSTPSRTTCNLQSAGLQQGCGQAGSKLGMESKLGLQRQEGQCLPPKDQLPGLTLV